MAIPSLSESIIRHHTTAQSFDRGKDYYRSQSVTAIAKRGNTIQADAGVSMLISFCTKV